MSSDFNQQLKIAHRIGTMTETEKSDLVREIMNSQPEAFVTLVEQIEMVRKMAKEEPLIGHTSKYRLVIDRYHFLYPYVKDIKDHEWETIHRLSAAGAKVEAIKHLRVLSGIGLKEAKDAVEALDLVVRLV